MTTHTFQYKKVKTPDTTPATSKSPSGSSTLASSKSLSAPSTPNTPKENTSSGKKTPSTDKSSKTSAASPNNTSTSSTKQKLHSSGKATAVSSSPTPTTPSQNETTPTSQKKASKVQEENANAKVSSASKTKQISNDSPITAPKAKPPTESTKPKSAINSPKANGTSQQVESKLKLDDTKDIVNMTADKSIVKAKSSNTTKTNGSFIPALPKKLKVYSRQPVAVQDDEEEIPLLRKNKHQQLPNSHEDGDTEQNALTPSNISAKKKRPLSSPGSEETQTKKIKVPKAL